VTGANRGLGRHFDGWVLQEIKQRLPGR